MPEEKMIYGKGDNVKFTVYGELGPYTAEGVIIGYGAEVRKRWPAEMGEAPDNLCLVKVTDRFDNLQHHVIFPEDIIEEE